MPKMAYFLAKSDPSEYSLLDLKRDDKTVWNGVKNPAALQAIRSIRQGDCVLIYHSQGESSIVGWAYATEDSSQDPANPKLAVVSLRYGGTLAQPLTLAEVKANEQFADFALVRQGRLSTMAVPVEFIRWLKTVRKDFKP